VAAFSPCPGRHTGCRASRRPRRSGRLRPPAAIARRVAGGGRSSGCGQAAGSGGAGATADRGLLRPAQEQHEPRIPRPP
jgi:hypothetical protein